MPGRRHEHCDNCYNARCQLPLHITLSCMVVKCPKSCGSVFHQCKQEEHRLLCPNETVPCLNALYGCPLSVTRCRLAKHLEVCPASVVCCSKEWNRWPAAETDLTFYKNVSENPHSEEDLDVGAALRDQELLFQSIKMGNVFPEFIQQDSPLDADGPDGRVEEVKEEARSCCSGACGELPEEGCVVMEEKEVKELSQEEREALATSKSVESLESYASWEKMFNKEKQGCQQTVKNLDRTKEKEEEEQGTSAVGCRNNTAAVSNMNGESGWAPWHDGVMERLSREANIGEYNMYLVHNGAMLINFGQLAACTPREKDFVYGSLEPVEVQSVHTYNVPTSYRAKRHHLKDPMLKAAVHRGVDTADLGEPVGGLPLYDEVAATLLCCLERELKGHQVSESAGVDGLYVDVGTQTYSFAAAPFRKEASLADLVTSSGRPHRLHLQVQTESVTRRHNRRSSAFSYTCGHFFRRDECRHHFRNAHADIQASLGGWLQQRCPLAYLGCTFTQTRLEPAGHPAAIKFRGGATSFVLQPDVASSLGGSEEVRREAGQDADPLSCLPLEVLQQIAAYLDSYTLSQLALVSHLMREVVATLLQDRGMVSLKWEKKTYNHGGSTWKCRKKVWQFSSAFSSVDRWSFSNIPSMSDHLKSCSYYQREERAEPVALACLAEVKEKICSSKA